RDRKKSNGGISQRKPERRAQDPGGIRLSLPHRIRAERPLPLPESLPLSRQLQRMCGDPSGSSGTCPQLHASHDQPNDQATVRAQRTHIPSDNERLCKSSATVGTYGFKILRSSSRFCTASLTWLSGSCSLAASWNTLILKTENPMAVRVSHPFS